MLKIMNYAVGQLQANCYLIADEAAGKALVIDPGDDAEFLSEILLRHRLKPLMILATHGHFDHLMAARTLQLAFNLPFLVHQEDRFLVKSLRRRALYYLGVDPGPAPEINGYLQDRQTLKFGKASLTVVHTPGHTPGSVCFYSKKENFLLTGDLIFSEGAVGRSDFSYSDSAKLSCSIGKILKYPPATRIFSGHGKASEIGWELNYHRPA